jgi:hypothetical protein
VLAALILVALPILPQSWYGTLDPWSKPSLDGTRVLAVDPEQRDGLGSARTSLRDASGREIWSRTLEYSLRDAEVAEKGEVVGWAVRTETPGPRNQLGLVILDPEGKNRSVDWLADSAGYSVLGIVIVPGTDRAIVRLDQIHGDAFTGREREEWLTLRVSTGERLARFTPPVLQREGWAILRRVVAVRSTALLCCEAWFEGGGEALVELLDLGGQQVWSVALEEARPSRRPEYYRWMWSAERLSSDKAGEFLFQRMRPDQLVRWRVTERADAPNTWTVTELSREPHPLELESHPGVTEPHSFAPRILSERPLVTSSAGQPCAVGKWSDAALDGQGRMLVLEAEDAHLHRFDAQGEHAETIQLQDASPAVGRIVGVRADRFDLTVGDSFATWNSKGDRVTLAYDRWHHAFPRPARHAVEGSRWFVDTNELLRYADDDPLGAVTARIARHPDRSWFGVLSEAAIAEDGSLVTIDAQPMFGLESGGLTTGPSTITRFDAKGNGRDQFRARLGGTGNLEARGHWLAGNGNDDATCFLADLESKKVFGLSGEFRKQGYRILLPPVTGEFWVVDLKGKRLLRAALPGD